MRSLLAVAVALSLLTSPLAASVTLPAGTPVYGEIDEQVTSRKRETAVGDIVRARAWRNVVVDGEVLIRAGAPMVVRVGHVKKARIAGRKGQLELEAVSVRSVDGQEVFLDGGYDKSGHGRKALSITLAAVVAWPLIFIKGKQAVLDAGTVFDASVQADNVVVAEASAPRTIQLAQSALGVTVLYDEMDPEGKQQTLPVRLESCEGPLEAAAIVTVNEKEIPRLAVPVEASEADEGCYAGRGTVDLKELGKHLRKGINRFEIEAAGARAEVILDIEL